MCICVDICMYTYVCAYRAYCVLVFVWHIWSCVVCIRVRVHVPVRVCICVPMSLCVYAYRTCVSVFWYTCVYHICYCRSQKVGTKERRKTSINHPTPIFQLLGVYRRSLFAHAFTHIYAYVACTYAYLKYNAIQTTHAIQDLGKSRGQCLAAGLPDSFAKI